MVNLSLCTACKVVQYCTSSHQSVDRPAHRAACTKIKKAQANFEKEERTLRRIRGDDFLTDIAGSFWAITVTRPYIRARSTLAETLLKINSEQAVTTSLQHLLELLQLCPEDNMGVRQVIPALYLRLSRDEECYHFVDRWATSELHVDADCSLPGDHIENAGLFTKFQHMANSCASLSHLVAFTLLKIRLLIDLQSLHRAREFAGPHLPQEILDAILQNTTISDITRDPKIIECADNTPKMRHTKWQVNWLFSRIEKLNSHFWPALLAPGDNLRAQPQLYRHGDKGQMQLALQFNYNAWVETPGAIGVIEELLSSCSSRAARDASTT